MSIMYLNEISMFNVALVITCLQLRNNVFYCNACSCDTEKIWQLYLGSGGLCWASAAMNFVNVFVLGCVCVYCMCVPGLNMGPKHTHAHSAEKLITEEREITTTKSKR